MSADQPCPVCRGKNGQHKFTCPELRSERVVVTANLVGAADEVAHLRRQLAQRDATIARIVAARAEHPRCDIEDDEDEPTVCGWKRTVLDIDAALEEHGA